MSPRQMGPGERWQRLQGRLIERLIGCARNSERPWIVFTAGAMGVGKTHALRRLAERGDFPLRTFAVIDPDVVKSWLPEARAPREAEREHRPPPRLSHARVHAYMHMYYTHTHTQCVCMDAQSCCVYDARACDIPG